MGEVRLNFEVNPKHKEMFDKALNVWRQENVQRKMKHILLNEIQNHASRAKFQEFKEEIVKDLDQDLACVIKETGRKIYDWFRYMKNISYRIESNPEEDEKKKYFGLEAEAFINYCVDEIHWTEYGLIDELKTISLGWLNKADLSDFKKFCLACFLCDEALIDLFWEKLPNDIKDSDYSRYLKKPETVMIGYWISRKKSTLQTFIDDVNLALNENLTANGEIDHFDENQSVEENILNHISCFNYLTIQYLMKKSSHETVQKNMPVWFQKFCILAGTTQNVPVLLFLYNEMSEDAWQNTFSNYNDSYDEDLYDYDENIAETFLQTLISFPFQELLVIASNQLQHYLNDSNYCSLLRLVATMILEEKDAMLLRQLPHLWKILPKSAKERTAKLLLPEFFNQWDIPNIKMIINYTDLGDKREALLRIGYEKFMELIWENKFDMINQFVDEILICEDWEDDVKAKVKKMYQILMTDLDVKSAEEYLNSQSNKSDSYFSRISSFLSKSDFSEENRQNFTKKIHHEILFYYFLGKQRMELIREYFEKIYPDDLKTFKESIQNNEFTLDLIYKIWLQSTGLVLDSPENFCNEFLLWLFDSRTDEISAFQKNVLLENLKLKLRILFASSNRFEMIDLLLSWCFCTKKEIREIKSLFLGYDVPKKFEELMKKDDLETSKKLLDWVFSSEKNKRKFKSKFISSRKGIMALSVLIGTMKSEELDPDLKAQNICKKFKDYISYWMETFESMIIARRYLEEYRSDKKTGNEKRDEGNKIKVNSDGDSTTCGETEDESSDDENNCRSYFYPESITFKTSFWNSKFVMDEKNLDLFLNLLNESIKKKLHDMKSLKQ